MIALKPDTDRGLNGELHVGPRVNIRRFAGGASGGFSVPLLLSIWHGARGEARLRRRMGSEMIGSNGPATLREADRHESSRRNTRYWQPLLRGRGRKVGRRRCCPGGKNVFSSVTKCNEIYIPTRERNGREGSNGREERERKQ